MFFVAIMLASSVIFAQTTITGTVSDSSGPLPGATVMVKGTTNGVNTSFDGDYTLNNVPSDAILVVSFIGYVTQEINVADRTEINVSLEVSAEALDEVVITALGLSRSKKSLAYATAEIDTEELAASSLANPIASLQGKISGVNINTGTGGPQSSARITIRGNSSLGNNNQPLIVIDGVFIGNSISQGGGMWGSGQDHGNEMKNLNPDDFESFTVLKGGAASALYGSRAANGVIVIVTKKGKKSTGLGVSISHSTTFEDVYKTVDFQNEFGGGLGWLDGYDYQTDASGNRKVPVRSTFFNYGPKYDGQPIVDEGGRAIKWSAIPGNAESEFRTGGQYKTSVAISGGTDKSTAYVSFTNSINKGVSPTNSFEKRNFNLRLTHEINKYTNFRGGVKYTKSVSVNPARTGGGQSLIHKYVYGVTRHFDTDYWKNNYIDTENGGRLTGSDDPYGMAGYYFGLYENETRRTEDIFIIDAGVNIAFNENFDLDLSGSINSNDALRENKNRGSGVNFSGGSYSLDNSDSSDLKLNFLFTYKKVFMDGDLDIRASVGGEAWETSSNYNNSWTKGGLLIPDRYLINNSINDPGTRAYNYGVNKRTRSLMAFANIGWKGQLYVDITARNDWSSTLQYADNHGDPSYFYPSISTAWIFSKTFEMPEWVNFGKLRGSLSYTGNDAAIYQTNKGLSYQPNGNYNAPSGTVPLFGFDSSTLSNLNLENELKREFEIGVDLSMFDNKVNFNFSYYKSNTLNQILSLPVPSESGVSSQLVNAGDLQNSGIEIDLNYTPIKSDDFYWNLGVNFSKNKNEVVKLIDGVDIKVLEWGLGTDLRTVARAGQEYGVIETKYAYAAYQALDGSGNHIDHPNNGQKVIDGTGYYVRSSNYQGQGYLPVGNLSPDFLAGFHNTIRYKNITLNFAIDAKVGGDLFSGTYNYGSYTGTLAHTLYGRDEARGGIPYTDADGNARFGVIPDGVFKQGTTITSLATGNALDVSGMSYQDVYDNGDVLPMENSRYNYRLGRWGGGGIREHAVFENTYVAFRNLSIGYDFERELLDKFSISSLKVSLNARNLFYIYRSLPSDINPEALMDNKSGSAFEYGASPFTRSLGVAINLAF